MSDDDDLELEVEQVEGPRAGRIAFAKIEPLTLHANAAPDQALRAALIRGTYIERHNRIWHMGQIREEGRSIVGRIGFQTSAIAELWDEEREDFSEAQQWAGLTSPFAIDPVKLRVAFQLRPGFIRVKSFTGALQALMNATSDDRWRVYQELEPVPFDDWVTSVDRVVALRIRVERPNPHYGDRANVKRLIEGANARMAELAWKADPEALDGLDVSEPFIREALDHASEYGGYAAEGERADKPTRWDSEHKGAAEQREVDADPVTREVPTQTLREQLGDVEPAAEEGGAS